MNQNRQKRTPQFKAKLAIEALQGDLTLSELATKYDIDPRQITPWKISLLTHANPYLCIRQHNVALLQTWKRKKCVAN
jgi:transposase-like protein